MSVLKGQEFADETFELAHARPRTGAMRSEIDSGGESQAGSASGGSSTPVVDNRARRLKRAHLDGMMRVARRGCLEQLADNAIHLAGNLVAFLEAQDDRDDSKSLAS